MSKSRWNRYRQVAGAAACAATIFVAGNAHAGYGGPILSPPTLNFPNTVVGNESPVQTISVTAAASQSVVNLTSVSLPAGYVRRAGTCPDPSGSASSPCTIEVAFEPTMVGPQNGTVQVTATTFGIPGTSSVTVNGTGVMPQADLGFSPGSVTIDPTAVGIGGIATINATPISNGPQMPALIKVVIGLPPEVEPVTPLPSGIYSCGVIGTDIECLYNGSRPEGSYPALPGIQVRAIAFSPTPVNLPVTVSSNQAGDPLPNNNTVVLPLGIVGPDLAPAFDDIRDPVELGATITFRGTLENSGSGDSAASSMLQITPGPGLTFEGGSGSGWSCTLVGANVQCAYNAVISAGSTSNLLFLDFGAPASPATVSTTFTSQSSDSNPANNIQTQQTTVANNDFQISGSGAPTSAAPPFSSLLTLNPSYGGGGVLSFTEFTITANIPAGVTLVSFPGQPAWSCSPPAVNPMVCTFGGGGKRGNDPGSIPLPPLQIELSKQSFGTSTVPFVISADTGVPDANPADNTFNYVLNGLAPAPDLALNMVANPTTAAAGQVFGYELSVNNQPTPRVTEGGGVSATNVQVVDTLPANTEFVSFTQSGSGGTWSCAPGGGNVTCNLSGTLSPGMAAPLLTLNMRYTGSALPPGGSVLNSAVVSGMPPGDPNSNNNTASASTGITPASDLAVSVADSADPVGFGEAFSYSVDVRNLGPQTVGGANLQLGIDPALVELVSTTAGAGWFCSGGAPTINCSYEGAAVNSGQSFPTVTLNLRALQLSATSTHTLNATVTGSNPDPQTANNQASEPTTLRNRVSLRLSKVASRSTAGLGEVVDFTLTVSNGDSSVNGVVLLDTLPSGLEFISASGAGWTCSHANGTVDCRRPQLAAGAAADVVLSTRTRALGTLVNFANVRAVEVAAPANASASVEVANVGFVDLQLNKSVSSGGEVVSGGTVNYVFVVSNRGTVQAGNVRLEDPLPDGVQVTRFEAPAGVSCSGTDTLRCTFANPVLANESVTVRAEARVDRTVTSGCVSVPNTATASTDSTEADLTNNTSTASFQLCAPGGGAKYDLQLNIDPRTLSYASQALTLTLRNVGVVGYPGGPINFDFGSTGLRLESFNGCSGTGQTATCQVSPLAPGASLGAVDFRLRTTAATSSGGTVRVHVVPVAPGDVNEGDNEVLLTVNPGGAAGADLRLTGRALATSVVVGTTASFEFVATNLGPAVATGAVVTLNLPAGATLGNATNSFGACTTSGTQVRCTANGELAVNAAMTIALSLRAPEVPGNLQVSAAVTSTSNDPGADNNSVSATTVVRLRSEDEVGSLLDQCAALDGFARASVDALAAACANPTADMAPLCRALQAAAVNQNCAEVRSALSEITPKEVLAQSLLLKDFAQTQFFNVDARLSELRAGGGGFSASGLAFSVGGQTVSVGMLRDLGRALSGQEEAEEPAYDQDLVSPWGFFINGTISSGDQDFDSEDLRVKADFESRGLTAGVDYRFNPRLVGGVALGYARFDADVSERSTLDTSARSLTVYGSWYPVERWYLDGRISLGKASFDLDRRILFTVGGQAFSSTAVGSTDADQLTFALATGYHWQQGAWTITPNASFRHIKSEVDAFTESGAGQFNVAYGDQDFTSSTVAIGMQVNRPFSLSHGVLSPQFDVSFNREIDNDDLVLEARMVGASATEIFQLRDDAQDDSYGAAGLGFVYITGNGKQAYISYRRIFGQEGLDRATLNLGARFEF